MRRAGDECRVTQLASGPKKVTSPVIIGVGMTITGEMTGGQIRRRLLRDDIEDSKVSQIRGERRRGEKLRGINLVTEKGGVGGVK